jgi:hypothetical protein
MGTRAGGTSCTHLKTFEKSFVTINATKHNLRNLLDYVTTPSNPTENDLPQDLLLNPYQKYLGGKEASYSSFDCCSLYYKTLMAVKSC